LQAPFRKKEDRERMAIRSHTSWEKARTIALVGVLLASIPRPALAQAPDEAAKEHARELMTKGRQARANADLTAALQSFGEADAIMHVPTTGLELAKTLRDMGRLVEAADALERVEALPPSANEPEVFANARRAAKDMKLELDSRIPSLRVTCSPSDASGTRVTVDGKPVDPSHAAAGLRVDPGRHVTTAERNGAVQQRVVQLAESGSADVAFDFGSKDDALPRPTRSNKTTTSSYVMYGLTGLAVAGVGTGVGLFLWSNHRASSLDERCAPHCGAQQVTDLRIGYVAANVTTAIGVASGLAALTLYFVRPVPTASKRDASRSLGLSAGPGPDVTVHGTF